MLRVAIAFIAARLISALSLRPAIVTRLNLSWCFPEQTERSLQALTIASLAETVQLALESGMTFHWNMQKLDRQIAAVKGDGLLESALQTGRGVLLLVPHFGNWEFLALYLGRYKLVALYDPPRHDVVDDLLKQARERTGASLLPIDHQGLRVASRTLQRGGLLGILPDQVPDRRAGIHAPFFARPALTMTLVHRLIMKHEPIVLMGSATRTKAGFVIEIQNLPEGVSDRDPLIALTAMNHGIEGLVASNPAQYQWEYKRFKAPPDGTERLY